MIVFVVEGKGTYNPNITYSTLRKGLTSALQLHSWPGYSYPGPPSGPFLDLPMYFLFGPYSRDPNPHPHRNCIGRSR